MTVTQILEKLISDIAATGSVSQAWERTFGEGSYSEFCGELYDALRIKAAEQALCK